MEIELYHDVIDLVWHKHLWLAKWWCDDLHKRWYKMTLRHEHEYKPHHGVYYRPTVIFYSSFLIKWWFNNNHDSDVHADNDMHKC